jgi:hypothetical protein
MLFGSLRRLADGIRHLARLANSNTNTTLLISNYDNSPESKATSALDYFGCTRDMHYPLVELLAIFSLSLSAPIFPLSSAAFTAAFTSTTTTTFTTCHLTLPFVSG